MMTMIDRDTMVALRDKLRHSFTPENLSNDNIRKRAERLLIDAARDRDLKNRFQRSETLYRTIAKRAIDDYCKSYEPAEFKSRFGIGNREV